TAASPSLASACARVTASMPRCGSRSITARGASIEVYISVGECPSVVCLARHAVAFVRSGQLRDFGGERFGALSGLAFALRDADVDDHEHHGSRRLGN